MLGKTGTGDVVTITNVKKQWLLSPCEHDVQCPKSTEIFKNNNDSNFKGSYLPYIRKYQITQGLIEDYKIRR
jgi:hypothetical protein